MRDKIFYTICFGFLFGVFLRSFLFVDLYLIILFGVISFALILFFILISKNKWGVIVSIFVFMLCFGIFRFDMVNKPAPEIFESQVGQKVSFSGEIITEPSIKETNQQLTIETKIKKDITEILLSTDLETSYKYGDEINFTGTLKHPENFMTDQGKVFDYVNYLRKDGIFYVLSSSKIKIISRGNGNFLQSFLFSTKEKFIEKMNFAITGTESLFMGGLILGEKASFSQALRQSFVNTGTIHIIALSGYNVTIVAEWLMKLFAKVPFVTKNFGIGMGILAIILFIVMTGGSSTMFVLQKHIARELERNICYIGCKV
jgi:competence protein ComEC